MPHTSARPRITRASSMVALAFAAVLAVSGCAPGGGDTNTPVATDGVVIEHAHGSTVIPKKPERIVALSWMTPDIVAALGVNPVGVNKVWGADDSGFTPWFKEYVDENYGKTPEVIPYVEDGPNYEAIKALKPDLILGLYSGISDVEYERLSEIAPTVPYLKGPWDPGTWEDMTRTVGKAMWEDEKAEAAVSETEDLIGSLVEAHPEFTDKTFVWGLGLGEGATDLGVYLQHDPRVRITEALGFKSTPAMTDFLGTAEADSWSTGVSLEKLYDVQADLFAGWTNDKAEAENTVNNAIVSKWEPIAAKSYVLYGDVAKGAAISAPTVLSLQYVLPGYVEDLSNALDGKPTINGK